MPESILRQLTPDSITVHGQRKAEYIRPFPGSHSSSSSSSNSNSNSNSNKFFFFCMTASFYSIAKARI